MCSCRERKGEEEKAEVEGRDKRRRGEREEKRVSERKEEREKERYYKMDLKFPCMWPTKFYPKYFQE